MEYKKMIIYLMVAIILLNTMVLPITTYATPVAIPLVIEFGAGAKALLATILAARAVGIVFNEPESYLMMNNIMNPELEPDQPPEDQGPGDKFTWKELLGLGLIGGAVTQQLNDFIDEFKNKFGEVQEGNNFYGDTNLIYALGDISLSMSVISNNNMYNYTLFADNEPIIVLHGGLIDRTLYTGYSIDNIFYNTSLKKIDLTYTIYYTNTISNISYSPQANIVFENDILKSELISNSTIIEQPNNIINYYITNNSPIINPVQNPPPDKIYIPYLPTLDPDNDRIQEIILPTGEKEYRYIGTPDDYIDDVVNHITFDQLQNEVVPGVIVTPVENPLPGEDPYIVLNPGDYPTPFPNPDITLDPDIPENEQNVIPWIQVVINWISETNNSIKELVVPPEEYIPPELNFDPLKNIVILDKFPFSLPWDIKYVISQFISEDTKAPFFEIDFPIKVTAVNWQQDVKFDIDFEPFTPLANIMRIMLSLIFVIGLIILTRTFIGGA